jgi:phosphoribosyl-AMP cyclohydrolase / phosphoribosyl-ATP pyrophosphohydrolase
VTLADVVFDARGLVPTVVQEADTGEVLMVAWMNREALARTLETGLAHFWSRSRDRLWQKGGTSGHVQHVERVYVDCDADTLLVQVHQEGVACHTGRRACFFREIEGGEATGATAASATMLERLERTVAERKASPRPGSYVAALLAKGDAAICRKIGEEAVEVITAALGGEDDRRVVEEVADLWFHTIVLLGARGIPLADVLHELARRHGRRRIGAVQPSAGGAGAGATPGLPDAP